VAVGSCSCIHHNPPPPLAAPYLFDPLVWRIKSQLSWPRVSINSSLPRWDSTAYLCSFLVREALSFSKREIVSSPCETLIRATSFVSVKGGGMDFLFYFFSLIFKTTTFSALKYTIQLHPPSPMHLPSTSLTPPHVSASRASLPSPLTTQAADIWYGTSI
jgi:hypothetical protein